MKTLGFLLWVVQGLVVQAAASPCDLNSDGVVNILDVQLAVNQVLGLAPCTADLDGEGRCDVVDVQRVIIAALGGPCNAVSGLNPPVTVSLTPSTASLTPSQLQQFTATVTGAANSGATWSINPALGGLVSGETTAVYVAPSTAPTTQSVTITATSVADPSKTATAVITLLQAVTVSLSPSSVSLAPSGTRQFTATVIGTGNAAVTWSINPPVGAVSSTGLYTAPSSILTSQAVTVTAQSVADPTKSANAQVSLSTQANSFTYYVDSVNGSDSNPGTQAEPWKSIAKVNSIILTLGQSVGFARGGVWRETLTVGQSGTAGLPITFGAYGSGAQPILSGLDVASSWTVEAQGGTDMRGATLQGWWLLGEASGSNRADSSTNGNTLMENAGPIAHDSGPNSVITDAAKFVQASSQYLSRTNANLSVAFPGKSGAPSGSVSFGAWVKPGIETYGMEVMNMGCAYGLTINPSGAAAAFSIYDASYAWHHVNTNITINSGSWYHLVGTWNSATGAMHIYVNGADHTSSGATAAAMVTTTDLFRIGGNNSCFGNHYLDGTIAEPFVIGAELSPAQISSIYSHGISGGTFNAYYTAVSSDPIQVLEDGVRLQPVASKSLLTTGTWYLDLGTSRLYIRTVQDDSPNGHSIEIGARDHVITTSGAKYLTFQNITWRGARQTGMFFYGDITGLLVDSCVGEYNGSMGFSLFDSTDTTSVTNVVFRNNTIRYNGAGGIESSLQHFANWLIDSNVIYQNSQISTDSTGALLTGQAVYAAGIDLNSLAQAGGSGTVISNNQVYNNGMVNGKPSPYPSQGVGIWSDTTTGMTVRNNFTYGNSGPGLLCEKTLNSTWSYNVSYNDSQYALTLRNDSNGLGSLHVVADEATNGGGNLFVNNTIYGGWWGIAILSTDTSTISNNIFRNNIAVAAAGHNFWAGAGGNNDGTHGSGNIYDHNAFGVAGPALAYWNGLGAITTYSSLDSAYGSAMNNLQADPLLTNPSAGDFTLQPGSPAVGAGVYIPGVSTVNPPNIGAK